MAISDKEKQRVIERFMEAQDDQRLQEVAADGAELVYPVDEEEAIVAVRLESGPHRFDIWAIDRTSSPVVGVKVGTQNEYGQFNWKLSEE